MILHRQVKMFAAALLLASASGDVAEADRLGITVTPTFIINGRFVSGAQPYENFVALIEREASRSRH